MYRVLVLALVFTAVNSHDLNSTSTGTCGFTEKSDCSGNDIYSVSVADEYDCCDLCATEDSCNAFTLSQYDFNGNLNPTCYLKTACDSMISSDTCTAGVKLAGSSPPIPAPTPYPTKVPVPTASMGPTISSDAPVGSPVYLHGKLSVQGNKIVDQHGIPTRLAGLSLFWSCWGSGWWNEDTVSWLHSDWNASIFRAPMAIDESPGYLDTPDTAVGVVEDVVRAAIATGMYVIVDWHEENADQHVSQATEFFTHMAQTWGSYPNIIWEPFNEPTSQDWSSVLKPYHETIYSAIRAYSDNIISMGTPNWSQDVDTASNDPVSGINIAYTVHFYAGVHTQWLRDKVTTALDNGVAVFATEWGASACAEGYSDYEFDEVRTWASFNEANDISSCQWGIYDKDESCADLYPGASTSGGWNPDTDLTPGGVFVREYLRGENP